MRIAVIGHGSIGRRHAAISLELGHEVMVYDPAPPLEPLAHTEVVSSATDCLRGADAAVVASPSSEHAADVRMALELGVPTMVEKPLALGSAHAAELARLAEERGVTLSVGMSLRELPAVRELATLLGQDRIGELLRVSAWCGSWLPGWRPGRDYRSSYSARAELGGGVLLDVAVHELDYVLWLAGPASSVSAIVRHVSELETDVEDVALLALELESGALVDVTVDYFDRCYTRGSRWVGSRGTLLWSWEREQLANHDELGDRTRTSVPTDVASAYRRQLEHFLTAVVERSPPPVPASEARGVLAVLDAARVSSSEGRRVRLAPRVTLRDVRPDDSERLLEWRNDPDTRRWSRSPDEVTPAEHASWLERSLRDHTMLLSIAESEGTSVGHVRATEESEGKTELHITIAPAARGRGFATAVLIEAAARALARQDVDLLAAHVKPENTASLRAFGRAGFDPVGTDEEGLIRLERASARRPVAGATKHSRS